MVHCFRNIASNAENYAIVRKHLYHSNAHTESYQSVCITFQNYLVSCCLKYKSHVIL